MTVEEKNEIDNMSHEQMASLWRNAPSAHKYFGGSPIDSEISNYFYDKFKEFGGMTTVMSKKIGW